MRHYNSKPVEVREHFYSDNPRDGPPDAWTTLAGVEYYFLGNGRIQAAVQVSSSGAGTPAGLLIMDPEEFGPKSRSLSFDPAAGLQPTMLALEVGGNFFYAQAGKARASWTEENGVPAVKVIWRGPSFSVSETFFCPEKDRARLSRRVEIKNLRKEKLRAFLRTGLPRRMLSSHLEIAGGKTKIFHFEYSLTGGPSSRRAKIARGKPASPSLKIQTYWKTASRIRFASPLLNQLYAASLYQLPAIIAHTGKLDGSIWQYNREWARDQAMVAFGLILSGKFELAKTIIARLLEKFVAASGATVDSSEKRPLIECELDQNGVLLIVLEKYVLWTGDRKLIKRYWPKIEAAADFPLKKEFRHAASGLLHNRREFWERHAAHGIEDGIELAHQLWVSMGLSSASRLALLIGKGKKALKWTKAAQEIKTALLQDKKFGLVRNGLFIKRRKTSGDVQNEVHPPPGSELPSQVPLFAPGKHRLNPDTSITLPIAWEFISPQSRLACRTLAEAEKLWNQRWKGGGYGRYDVSSEPDSPGPWPFPSLFVARAYFEAGQDNKVWRILRWLERVPGGRAGSWFEFYGPRPVPPYPQVGIVPWTWAEMTILCIHHLLGIRPGYTVLYLRPRLLRGLPSARASIRFRDLRIHLDIRKVRSKSRAGFWVEGKFKPYSREGIVLPYPKKDIRIKVRIPPSSWKLST